MSLFSVSLSLTILGFVMGFGGLFWVGRIGELEKTTSTGPEAGDRVMRALTTRSHTGVGRTFFRGTGAGVGYSGAISTWEIMQLFKKREWRRALPWGTSAIGAILAIMFLPITLMLVMGASLAWTLAFDALFVVTVIRAAWPRRPG